MTLKRNLYKNLIILLIIYPIVITNVFGKDFVKDNFNYYDISYMPILDSGRIKPLDSFARLKLSLISGKESTNNLSAIEWLVESLLNHDKAYNRNIFYITNSEVLNVLSLKKRKGNRYSFVEVFSKINSNIDIINSLYKKDSQELSLAQNQLLDIYSKVIDYFNMSRSLTLLLPKFNIKNIEISNSLQIDKQSTYIDFIKKKEIFLRLINPSLYKKKLNKKEEELFNIAYTLKSFELDKKSKQFNIIPPLFNEGDWVSPWEVLEDGKGSPHSVKYFKILQDVINSYNKNEYKEFNIDNISSQISIPYNKLKLEVFYNKFNLIGISLIFYLIALLTSFIKISTYNKYNLQKISILCFFAAFTLHITAILLRIYITSRPPVTSLYESTIFVSLISSLIAIIIMKKRYNGYEIITGSIIAIILLWVSLGYSYQVDTMQVVVAVLNNNFWLATHVVTITAGYGSCLIGGVLSHIFLIKYIFSKNKNQQEHLFRNIFIISLVSLLLCITGTMLGGIWADQSWGRFWGWDPKENGALLIILWLILILHAKIAKIVSNKNFAILMVVTNIIVILAWFGVNLLNTGLHSYGFTENIASNIAIFCLVEILFIAYIQYSTKRLTSNV